MEEKVLCPLPPPPTFQTPAEAGHLSSPLSFFFLQLRILISGGYFKAAAEEGREISPGETGAAAERGEGGKR